MLLLYKKPDPECLHGRYTGENGFNLQGKMHVALFISMIYKLASVELRQRIRQRIDDIESEELETDIKET